MSYGIGFSIGGSYADGRRMGGGLQPAYGGSLTPAPAPSGAAPEVSLNQPKAEYGAVIPISFGTRRLSPQLIWATEIRGDATAGYFVDFAVSWGYNGDADPSATAISKLYANGSKIWSAGTKTMPGSWGVTLYTGTEDQGQDPTLVAQLGAANVPAYRNQLYGVFTNFPINEKWNYQIPGISAEVSGEIGIATAFNDYNPDAISVTDDGTTATLTDDADFRPAVTNSGHASGLRYFEVLLNDIPDTSIHYVEIGLATASFNTATDYLNLSPYALALRSQYDIQVNGNEDPEIDRYMGEPNWTAPEYEWVDGSRICFAVDLDNGLLWWKLNGNKWSGYLPDGVADWEEGDPTTGLHGFPYATYNPDMAGQELLLAVSLNDTAGESITLKPAEADFAYSPPTGYEAWGGIAGGSAPATSLIAFIQRIGEYAGLDPDADMSFDPAIDDEVTGAVIGANTTFGEFALNLGRWYGFDMYEGDALEFIQPIDGATYALDRTVPAADLLNQGDRAITTTRGEDDSPVVLEGQYIDQTQQFRFNTQRARRILYPVRSTQSHRQMQIAVPVIQTANQAITYLGRAIYRMASQNVLHQFDLGPMHLDITPGSLLGISSGDTAYDVKVTRMEIGPQLRVSINAVNLFTQEDLELESESGTPLGDYTGVEPPAAVTGAMAATEGADGFSGSGTVASPVGSATGTMAATEGADAFSGSGAVTAPGSSVDAVFVSAYTGTGSALSITGVGFQPDLILFKRRASSGNWHWVNSARGPGLALTPSTNTAEITAADGLTSFDADGFTVGTNALYNAAGGTEAAICFREYAQVFDQVTYTGTGAAQTIAHGLGVVPEFIIVHGIDSAAGWAVYTAPTGAGQYLSLRNTAAASLSTTMWNNTAPTSSVFSVGSNTDSNQSAKSWIAWLFASKTGVSKVGTYTADGNDQTINVGFTPRFVLIKAVTATSGFFESYDTAREPTAPQTKALRWSSTSSEATTTGVTLDASGLTIMAGAAHPNQSGAQYVYLALA